jgi:transketolase
MQASELIRFLQDKATLLRIHSIRATTAAGSGHPTSCASAADIVSVLFFSVMRYDPRKPRDPYSDTFVLSKGHAAPLLYAAWAEAGAIPKSELLNLRKIDSDLEGHPTPRLPFVDVATGSLGQGLCAGVGMALNAQYLEKTDQRIYVLLGDGESAEGSVWEAAEIASQYGLKQLCCTVDINRLGQSQPTMWQHDIARQEARWKGFGWNVLPVDGHDIGQLLEAYDRARSADRPTVVLARTIKGKGIPVAEGKENYHGKPLSADDADKSVASLERQLSGAHFDWKPQPLPAPASARKPRAGEFPDPPYAPGSDEVATRKAFGEALAALGVQNPDIVVLDGDVKNSTYTEDFEKKCPDRFFQMYIAEQNMVGATMGLAAKGKIPFAATFACFLTRAYDFMRMAAISRSNIKLMGSHAGVSIGEDGPSQMGLEDLAMTAAQPDFTVLYPSDAVSTWVATRLAADVQGPVYIRTTRPKTPVLYPAAEKFEIGKCKLLRQSANDQVTIVAAGITLFEALSAHEQLAREAVSARVIDLFSVQPIDVQALREASDATGGRIVTVEDHYAHGGIGDAVLSALSEQKISLRKLAVRDIPRSGKPEELIEHYGISAQHIIEAVKSLLAERRESSLPRTA